MNLVNKISCMLVVGSLLWSFFQYRYNLAVNGHKHPRQKAEKIKWELMAVLIIMLAGFFRLYMLGAVPEAVNQDSAMSAIDAKSLVTLGTDHWGIKWPVHMKGWGYSHQNPLLTYLISNFVWWFRGSMSNV